MNRTTLSRVAALDAVRSPEARRMAELERLSPETRRAQIAALVECLGPEGMAAALRRGGAEGAAIARKLGLEVAAC